MIDQALAHRRVGAVLCALLVSACGGGGGGGDGSPSGPAYQNVQPPSAPSAEVVDTTRAVGKVSLASDTLDPAGRHAGVSVALNEVLGAGVLGPVVASTVTGADGSFEITLPGGASASDGRWLVTATSGPLAVRAYLHAGAMRVDVGSEAWVRLVEASVGRLPVFPASAASRLKSMSRALSLYADVLGSDLSGLAPSAAADSIAEALRRDRAMGYVLTTLSGTGGLPATGVGDIGGFSALSSTYAGEFVDGSGARVVVTLRPESGSSMAADGSWSFAQAHATRVGDQLTPVAGAGGYFRATPAALLGRLTLSGVEGVLLSNAVGEYTEQSFPLQAGERQLDARRIEATGLNFTGGTDEQPMSFSSVERVLGVETIDSAAGSIRAVKVEQELELGVPTSSTGVSRLTLRTTSWRVPAAGTIKSLDQALVDGRADPTTPDETHELVAAWASNEVWPHRVTFQRDMMWAWRTTYRCATQVPGTQRFVTVEAGPVINGSPTLALASRDIETGNQIGPTRAFAGFWAGCPTAIGRSGNVLLTETFFDRQTATPWPAAQADASAASDVVHIVDGSSLLGVASRSMPAVADATQPALYWPGIIRFVQPAPDGSGTFLAATTQYDDNWTRQPMLVRVFAPGGTSPVADLGSVQVHSVDWQSGRLFTKASAPPFSLHVTSFSSAGVDVASTRTLIASFPDGGPWHASEELLYLNDSTTVRIGDGTAGPTLPFPSDLCGADTSDVLCLDWRNDQLVRFDPATGLQRSVVPLGSFLRGLSPNGVPDYRTQVSNLQGIGFQGDRTYSVGEYNVRVGRW